MSKPRRPPPKPVSIVVDPAQPAQRLRQAPPDPPPVLGRVQQALAALDACIRALPHDGPMTGDRESLLMFRVTMQHTHANLGAARQQLQEIETKLRDG